MTVIVKIYIVVLLSDKCNLFNQILTYANLFFGTVNLFSYIPPQLLRLHHWQNIFSKDFRKMLVVGTRESRMEKPSYQKFNRNFWSHPLELDLKYLYVASATCVAWIFWDLSISIPDNLIFFQLEEPPCGAWEAPDGSWSLQRFQEGPRSPGAANFGSLARRVHQGQSI